MPAAVGLRAAGKLTRALTGEKLFVEPRHIRGGIGRAAGTSLRAARTLCHE